MVPIMCPISFSVFIFFRGWRDRVHLADFLVFFPFLVFSLFPAHSLHFRDDTLLLSCLAHNVTCRFAVFLAVSSAMGIRRLDCSHA